jgi:hypothetical protein
MELGCSSEKMNKDIQDAEKNIWDSETQKIIHPRNLTVNLDIKNKFV